MASSFEIFLIYLNIRSSLSPYNKENKQATSPPQQQNQQQQQQQQSNCSALVVVVLRFDAYKSKNPKIESKMNLTMFLLLLKENFFKQN